MYEDNIVTFPLGTFSPFPANLLPGYSKRYRMIRNHWEKSNFWGIQEEHYGALLRDSQRTPQLFHRFYIQLYSLPLNLNNLEIDCPGQYQLHPGERVKSVSLLIAEYSINILPVQLFLSCSYHYSCQFLPYWLFHPFQSPGIFVKNKSRKNFFPKMKTINITSTRERSLKKNNSHFTAYFSKLKWNCLDIFHAFKTSLNIYLFLY